MAAMFAIYKRDQGGLGTGREIDVSLFEPLCRLVEAQVIGYDQLGIVKERQGNRLAEDSPRNTCRTRDNRRIAISASSQRTFVRPVETMSMPELATDPRFQGNFNRCRHDEVLDRIMAEWFVHHDLDDIMERFNAAGVVAGPIHDIRDIFADPHYAARQAIVAASDVDSGSVRMQGVVPRMGTTPGRATHAGGPAGADNDAIYGEELGLSEAERQRLAELGVI